MQAISDWIASNGLLPYIAGGIAWSAIMLAVGVLADRIVTRGLRKMFERGSFPVAGAKLTIRLLRVVVWVLVVSIALDAGWGFDLTGLVAALGLGALVISLGFQDALANLIGGIQVSMQRVVEIGDHVEISGREGIVTDLNLRHTTVRDFSGNILRIPNSVLNSSTLATRIPDYMQVEAPVNVLHEKVTELGGLDEIAQRLAALADEGCEGVCELSAPAQVIFTAMSDYGYTGVVVLKCAYAEGLTPAKVKNAVLRKMSTLLG